MAMAAATTTKLPPCATAVVMKTPMVTAMAGTQTTINNQLKASTTTGTETATMTAMTMRMETKAMAGAEGRWQHLGGGGQLGGDVGILARALWWQRQQRGGGVGSGNAAAV